MRSLSLSVTIAFFFCMSGLQVVYAQEFYGAWTNPTGDPVGGGAGYSKALQAGDYTVATKDELIDALSKAQAGDVIFVAGDAVIDMSGEQGIEIPGSVTLASDRGDDSPGAILYSVTPDVKPFFKTAGDNVRITGLRLRGPDMERRTEQLRQLMAEGGHTAYYSVPTADGIISSHMGLVVDNCELWGWSHAAIFLTSGAGKVHVHHNYIHHNQRSGLGYGVCLDQANALVEANLFDWCRHHIAGTGRPGTSYEARYNVVLANGNGHSFDMHGGRDRNDKTDIAGDSIVIHHNMFMAVDVPAFVIRGVPQEKADVHHNWFFHETQEEAVRQTNKQGNITVHDNVYGMERRTHPAQ